MAKPGIKDRKQDNLLNSGEADGVDVTIYTDPLCCWSWATWPQWRKFRASVVTPMTVTYKMAGLLPSWDQFNDSLNAISKPIQMAPEWAHAKRIGHVPINDRIWITDPPESSFPACIAVKAVAQQSGPAAEAYFFSLQNAVMVRSLNIAHTPVLFKIATELANEWSEFDPFLFRDDLLDGRGKGEFMKDLQETKYLRICRFPTFVFRTVRKPAMVVSGYQSFESFQAATTNLLKQ
ncbi:MAG TPA: DsbA family protein [Puia sp.]|jgi:predicted DsbA family dithiol-disulfide isomerase|nr:DsbA family protein [Puia sp.]